MKLCDKPAVMVLVWPSMQETPVCAECMNRASGIASAMGFRLGTLPALGDLKCTQQVREQSTP